MSGLDLIIITAVKNLIAYWSTTQGLTSFLGVTIIGGMGATAISNFNKAKKETRK